MSTIDIRALLIATVFLAFGLEATVSAQTIRPVSPSELATLTRQTALPERLASSPGHQFAAKYRRMLSGSGHNALYGKWRRRLPELQKRIDSLRQPPQPPDGSPSGLPEAKARLETARRAAAIRPVPTVNDKGFEYTDANTQSETSVAVFGSNVVVGYNSSSNFAAGSGFMGYSYSTNGGTSFTEVSGGLSPIGSVYPLGDPALVVDDAGNFYFATIALDLDTDDSYVLVYKSTDGGATFAFAFGVVTACCDFLDKELIAIDNNSGSPFKGTLYITFTDFLDGDGTLIYSCAFTAATGSDLGCVVLTGEDSQGSIPAVGPNGELYVAWEQSSNTGSSTGQAIFLAKSTDGGATFSAPTKISDVTPILDDDVSDFLCDQPALVGGIRVGDFPAIAVDTGPNSKLKGTVYVTWNDMRSGDADILGVRSTNGGASWEGPTFINNNSGDGTDQFFPWVSVLPNGRVGVMWYDRRNDQSNNWWIDVFLGLSSNGGTTWSNTAVTKKAFPVIVNADSLTATCYMGDYNQITNNGKNFLMAWGDNSNGNPDIVFGKK